MNSIWIESAELPDFPKLEKDIQTDVLIVGGGMAGILCAYFLQKENVDYTLVEGGKICSGVTKNTTAKITAQHGLIYDKLLKTRGTEITEKYYKANQNALKKYASLCKNIDCDFEKKTAYVYSIDNRAALEKEADALRRIGVETEITETTSLPFETAGAIRMKDQAQFHPLKFISAIVPGLTIYEYTFVKELLPGTAVTETARIHYKKIIFTTHFPMDNKHGMYFLKLYQHRSYVIALENGPKIDGMYLDEATCGMSFRNYKTTLLIGGGDHRTGKKGGKWQELRNFANRYYPECPEKYAWAAQDCMSLDGVPYIGQYSLNTPNCYVATGFNKWGMNSSMAAAQILTDLVLERENPFAEVFAPSRSIWKPQLFINGATALGNLLTISQKRCPHMGCALKWNPQEHSWDCTCHGSRFDENGTLLNNPANGNLPD